MTPLELIKIIIGPYAQAVPDNPEHILVAFYMLLALLPTYIVYSLIRQAVFPSRENGRQVDEKIVQIFLLTILVPLYFLLFILFISLVQVKPFLLVESSSMIETLSILVNDYGVTIVSALFITAAMGALIVVASLDILGFKDYWEVLIDTFVYFVRIFLALLIVFALLPYYINSVAGIVLLFVPGAQWSFLIVLAVSILPLIILWGTTKLWNPLLFIIKVNRFFSIINSWLQKFILKIKKHAIQSILLALLALLALDIFAYDITANSLSENFVQYLEVTKISNGILKFSPKEGSLWRIFYDQNAIVLDSTAKYGTNSITIECNTVKKADFYIFTLRGWWAVSLNKEIEKHCT